MKIFQSIEKSMESGGFIRNQRAFNRTQSEHIVKMLSFMGMLYIYLGCEASTLRQYMDSILLSTVGTLGTIAYMSEVFKYATMFELIDDIERAVNESEFTWKFRQLQNINSKFLLILLQEGRFQDQNPFTKKRIV